MFDSPSCNRHLDADTGLDMPPHDLRIPPRLDCDSALRVRDNRGREGLGKSFLGSEYGTWNLVSDSRGFQSGASRMGGIFASLGGPWPGSPPLRPDWVGPVRRGGHPRAGERPLGCGPGVLANRGRAGVSRPNPVSRGARTVDAKNQCFAPVANWWCDNA